MCRKTDGWVANSVNPDQTPRSAASDLGPRRLLWLGLSNTLRKFGTDEREKLQFSQFGI